MQYRFSHVVSTFGSAIFGFIWIAIWRAAAGPSGGLREYTVQNLVYWAAFGQAMFNLVSGDHGLNIPLAVRSGDVSLELLRPLDYFAYVISRETGQQIYRFFYRTIPIFLIYVVTVGYYHTSSHAIALLLPSLFLALYVALCIQYLAGIAAFWTTDIRWAWSLHYSLLIVASGIQMPVDLLPGFVGEIAPYLPWSVLAHYPNRIYLELDGANALVVPVIWAIVLTIIARWLTLVARKKLEVQGG